jgi:hypothetical protein
MSALLLAAAALAVALAVAWRAACYRRDIRESIETESTIAWLRSMRQVDFDDHAATAIYAVADDLERRRIDAAIRRHPAGRQR